MEMHILGMGMDSIGRNTGDRRHIVLVNTAEVAHIHKESEIFVVYCIKKPLHTIAVLSDISVVLTAGLDALLCRVFGYLTGVRSKGGSIRSKFLPLPSLKIW